MDIEKQIDVLEIGVDLDWCRRALRRSYLAAGSFVPVVVFGLYCCWQEGPMDQFVTAALFFSALLIGLPLIMHQIRKSMSIIIERNGAIILRTDRRKVNFAPRAKAYFHLEKSRNGKMWLIRKSSESRWAQRAPVAAFPQLDRQREEFLQEYGDPERESIGDRKPDGKGTFEVITLRKHIDK